tara:strand:- start:130 stop:261 length:132 start_codon:yes stop_codon:yes gene_type:complete
LPEQASINYSAIQFVAQELVDRDADAKSGIDAGRDDSKVSCEP